MRNLKLVSIVTPVYNEILAIDTYFNVVLSFINNNDLNCEFEIIITDNCSTDGTFEKCKHYAKNDNRIKVYKFIKNYGYQKSIYFGYSQSKGQCALQLDCDLQDPIELLPNFLEYYKQGYDLIYGIREKRKESFLNQLLRKTYYKLVRRFSESDLPLNAGDFMLVGRKSLDALIKISYENIYVRGELHSLGVKKIGIKYSRKARKEGSSKFRLFSINLLSLAKDGFFSQSNLPLRLSVYFFISFFILSTVGIITYFFLKIIGIEFPDGYLSLVLFILLSIAINSLFFGIIGEYILRIYSMLKSESECIVQDKFINGNKNKDT